MTDVSLDGRIVNIVTKERFKFVTYSDLRRPEFSPTIINPTGADISIIGCLHDNPGSTNAGFILSDDFKVGDIIIIHKTDIPYTGNIDVYDSNMHSVMSVGPNRGGMSIKISSGTNKDWLTIVG